MGRKTGKKLTGSIKSKATAEQSDLKKPTSDELIECHGEFKDIEALRAALEDIGQPSAKIEVRDGRCICSVPASICSKVAQYYAKHKIIKAVSKTPGHRIQSIKEIDGKIRIKISVR